MEFEYQRYEDHDLERVLTAIEGTTTGKYEMDPEEVSGAINRVRSYLECYDFPVNESVIAAELLMPYFKGRIFEDLSPGQADALMGQRMSELMDVGAQQCLSENKMGEPETRVSSAPEIKFDGPGLG